MEVLVLGGGDSSEREVSLRSAMNVKDALISLGHTVHTADPAEKDFDLEKVCKGVEVVFPILHGKGGEDGVIQKQLEELDMLFLGSGSLASELTFDKALFKEMLQQHNILTPGSEIVSRDSFEHSGLLKNPFVLKPVDGGSSIDTFIVRNPTEMNLAEIKDSFWRHERMLLEELIEGQEITVPVLGESALPVILIVPPEGKEFDYENKYNGASKEIISPPDVSTAIQQKAQRIAEAIHKLSGCRHLSRTDMIIQSSGELQILELNTMPGMTSQSLFPKAAEAAGLPFDGLVEKFLSLASSK